MSDADTVAAKESTPGDATRRARSVQGSVESARMDKTITVLVERQLQHPLYKKYIKKDKKYSAHDENNKFKIGDFVQIRECAPKSKTKTFEVVYSD